jgi:uncharacterized protein DUF5681
MKSAAKSKSRRGRRPKQSPTARRIAAKNRYRVGPGFPPREYQWPKGTSGNPKGKQKTLSTAPDLKALLERALNAKVKGERDKMVTKAAAGIERLVDQFAKGDPRGRRDFILLCKTFGIDLTNSEALQSAIADAVSAEDEALLADFVRRHGGHYYPLRADTAIGLPINTDRLGSSIDDMKLLNSPAENSEQPVSRQGDDHE